MAVRTRKTPTFVVLRRERRQARLDGDVQTRGAKCESPEPGGNGPVAAACWRWPRGCRPTATSVPEWRERAPCWPRAGRWGWAVSARTGARSRGTGVAMPGARPWAWRQRHWGRPRRRVAQQRTGAWEDPAISRPRWSWMGANPRPGFARCASCCPADHAGHGARPRRESRGEAHGAAPTRATALRRPGGSIGTAPSPGGLGGVRPTSPSRRGAHAWRRRGRTVPAGCRWTAIGALGRVRGVPILARPWPQGGALFTTHACGLACMPGMVAGPGGVTRPMAPGRTGPCPASACEAWRIRTPGTHAPRGHGRSRPIREDEPRPQNRRAKSSTTRGRAARRQRPAGAQAISHQGAPPDRRARDNGLRQNQFASRRHAAVSTLPVAARAAAERALASCRDPRIDQRSRRRA
jgi:hypothetical protein